MAQTSARILLLIFFASVSTIPLVEFGHSILHSFKNPFHYHHHDHEVAGHSHHSLSDHHPVKVTHRHEMSETVSLNNVVWFAYSYCELLSRFASIFEMTILRHDTKVTESLYAIHICPPTPPPVATL